jgi:hypothetical protein
MAAQPSVMPCRKCQGLGFVNVRRLERPGEPTSPLLARDVFEQGIPCNCGAGEWFRKAQEEWIRPIPKGRE